MKTVSKLVLLLDNFFLVSKTVTKSNILKTILMHFLVFWCLVLFPVLYHFLLELLTSTRKDSVHSNRAFKFLELHLNFLALGLLFIKFSLKFTSHAIVTILSLFEIVTDLMNVSKCIKILVLVKQLLLRAIFTLSVIHKNNFTLQVVVSRLQLFVLINFITDGLDKLEFHLGRWW